MTERRRERNSGASRTGMNSTGIPLSTKEEEPDNIFCPLSK